MNHHEHSLSCLVEIGGRLVCKHEKEKSARKPGNPAKIIEFPRRPAPSATNEPSPAEDLPASVKEVLRDIGDRNAWLALDLEAWIRGEPMTYALRKYAPEAALDPFADKIFWTGEIADRIRAEVPVRKKSPLELALEKRATAAAPSPAPHTPARRKHEKASRILEAEEKSIEALRAVPRETTPSSLDRDQAIRLIKDHLRRRSGKTWSVRGGRGTSWGWIEIKVPPREMVRGEIPVARREELGRLLGLGPDGVASQGVSIPASSAYRREYVDRAMGKTPTVRGTPYWD
jgi:hypothetical protein